MLNRVNGENAMPTLVKATRLDVSTVQQLAEATFDDTHDIDGTDPQADNDQRAVFGAAALVAYTRAAGDFDDLGTQVADLLADLRHLCDALGLDYDEAERRGTQYYHSEIQGGWPR